MESTNSYLHKKFKKQLSVTPRVQNDKENKDSPRTEPSEEETTAPPDAATDSRIVHRHTPSEHNQPADQPSPSDNNDSVPKQSTKTSSVIHHKSSISLETHQQSSNSYISHVVSNQAASFDTTFKEQTNHSASSILDSHYHRPTYANEEAYHNHQEECPDLEAPPQPDKNPNGKYVCPYCSLVCSKPSVLQKHIRAHTNERPFPCTSCGFSFKTRSNLYKHCRSRTHANRVMGTEKPESSSEGCEDQATLQKPYKPRFHTALAKENVEEEQRDLSHHLSDIINKNNPMAEPPRPADEPLNLTSNNRKRSLSEVAEPVVPKSLIKELLLKNLSASDMQCPHCKMIFQTVTELDVHKYRGNCKGRSLGARYARSSSVNVASILTKNKNAFDNIPQLQHTVFPLSSPGPFLGKTRLVDGDKGKSFSFDAGNLPLGSPGEPSPSYLLSPSPFDRDKKPPGLKLFGGEVKVQAAAGEAKGFKVDCKEDRFDAEPRYGVEYGGKGGENRVVKSSLLQSGGTVLTNKTNYGKQKTPQEAIRAFEASTASPIDFGRKFTFDRPPQALDATREEPQEAPDPRKPYPDEPSPLYKNIMDFSQTVLRRLTPNLKQPNFTLANVPVPRNALEKLPGKSRPGLEITLKPPPNLCHPVNLLVNGKVVRHVPGMPGPVVAPEGSPEVVRPSVQSQPLLAGNLLMLVDKQPPARPPVFLQPDKLPDHHRPNKSPEAEPPPPPPRRTSRPSSLALKPTAAVSKQHHGLTPTMFNQILISPETPRVAKKSAEHLIQGHYFSYLGLKSSTKPVYCTLNKTQPFYVPHFKRLSMYSEWRQQDTRQDRLYVCGYDSRQRGGGYTVAGGGGADLMTHSSYKFMVSESSHGSEKDDEPQKNSALLGGYESNEDYTYIRGRGRGRYVCDQCGIRCKKPSMLKKHIRTHSNDRPYTCGLCNFSFKTKGNLTKHMKSKAHSKNSTASSGSSSSTQLSAHSSDSDTDDSGMDSSDESTRQQEHEAAYGLLSLSQKPAGGSDLAHLRSLSPSELFMTTEEIAHVSQATYARNKILDEHTSGFDSKKLSTATPGDGGAAARDAGRSLGTAGPARPLTYPYSVVEERQGTDTGSSSSSGSPEPKSIKQFHVIQKYTEQTPAAPNPVPTLKVNDVAVAEDGNSELRKRKLCALEAARRTKMQKGDEVIDLSMAAAQEKVVEPPAVKNVVNEIDVETPVNNGVGYDNSAMETLADIATKQVKLEKNTLAKSVASEFLKLATKNEGGVATAEGGGREVGGYAGVSKDVNDLIAKSEGNKSCTVCAKSFNKPSQLRLHMNIHYLERPFRCESCSVSFRTKGHLQKHERSAGHNNKLSSSPTLSSSEPRPFKCTDCSIAFRIHGHLAKHLRSKLHIMKLECLAKIPFGLYAELERSNSLLTEINTCDGDQCLESLKILAKKVLINEPSKLNPVEIRENFNAD